MAQKKYLFFKSFSVSLLIHIAGISLFSLVLPIPRHETKPIEVSLLPPSTIPESKIELARVTAVPKIPQALTKDEKIALLKKPEALKFAVEQFAGSQQNVPVTQITRRFEIPEFEIQLPDIFSHKSLEQNLQRTLPDINIEGPAGSRGLLYREKVEYPDWAQEKGIEGNIQIKFWVDPDGKVALTNLVSSSGFPELDMYAEQNLRKWLFEPVATNKQAWGIITFRFRLK